MPGVNAPWPPERPATRDLADWRHAPAFVRPSAGRRLGRAIGWALIVAFCVAVWVAVGTLALGVLAP